MTRYPAHVGEDVRRKHDWECMGGGGGWEVWECRRCHRSTIPAPFGFLWPTVLQLFLPRYRCTSGGGR